MPSTTESISDRKARERARFLALPPAEAQRLIDFRLAAPLVDCTEPNLGLGSGLVPDEDDELVD